MQPEQVEKFRLTAKTNGMAQTKKKIKYTLNTENMRDWTTHTQLERQAETRVEEAGPFKTQRGGRGN